MAGRNFKIKRVIDVIYQNKYATKITISSIYGDNNFYELKVFKCNVYGDNVRLKTIIGSRSRYKIIHNIVTKVLFKHPNNLATKYKIKGHTLMCL